MSIFSIIRNVFLLFVIILTSYLNIYSQQDERVTKPQEWSNATKDIFANVPSDIKSRCDNFFNLLQKAGVEKAFKELLEGSPIGENKEQVDNLISQTKRANNLYGMIKGYEAISFEAASYSLIRLRYLGLHPDSPTRWIFTFYKSPVRGWIIVHIKFDDLSEFLFSDE